MKAESMLVLVGPHGAGKTTMGRRLAEELGIPFHEEIGRFLREKALARDIRAHAMATQEEFDERVIRLEIERDLAWGRGARIVETWHPGNLAYASLRSPVVYERMLPDVRALIASLRTQVLVQPLTISRRCALERLSESGPDRKRLVDFLLAVGERAITVADDIGLRVLPPLGTETQPIRLLAEQVADAARGLVLG